MVYLLIGGHAEGTTGPMPDDFQGYIQEKKVTYVGEGPKEELGDKYVPIAMESLLSEFVLFRLESMTDEEALAQLVTGYFESMKKKHNRIF